MGQTLCAGDSRVNRRVGLVTAYVLLLALGWGCTDDPTGPDVDPFCSTRPAIAVVTFEDANLEAAIRTALAVEPQGDLTCGLVEALPVLTAGSAGIMRLAGIENLTGLTTLWIRANSITDIGALSGLTGLTSLNLADNSLTDISALSGLTNLTFLAINENETITDVSALSGLTNLTGTLWMHSNSIIDIGPLSGLTNLTAINAWNNSITDLTALSALTGLTQLRLHLNSITDLSPLSRLTDLELLFLHANPDLSDIGPLLDNPGLGEGAAVNVASTNVSCEDVDALKAKGVSVISDCP